MEKNRLLTIFVFLLALLWGVSELKEAGTRLQFEIFNKPVIVKVVDIPMCGRSNIIGVRYQYKEYNISINKNDCIKGRYNIGDTLEATYNPKLDEINPKNFAGVYRLYTLYMVLVGSGFSLYLFFSNRNQRLKKQ